MGKTARAMLGWREVAARVRVPPLGRTATVALMRQLGGADVPGLGLVVTEGTLSRYLESLHTRERERRHTWGQHGAEASEAYPSTNAKGTGSATSEPRTAADSSELCTSEPTAATPANAPQSRHTGKSKAEQRLELMLKNHASRSGKRSKR